MIGRVDGLRAWRHPLAGCLHACAATLLDFHGYDPLDALGSAWGFYYVRGDVRREEYYYPCPPYLSLLEALAPNHSVRSRWREPVDEEQSWSAVRAEIVAGRPVAVAVDNFHLPFRPAYHDVHANHLILVYGFDDERGTVRVLDEVPPRFDGEIRLAELTAARHSANPALHERDRFFTAAPIAGRWLELEAPSRDRSLLDVHAVLRSNLASLCMKSDRTAYRGINGLRRFLSDTAQRIDRDPAVRDELFVVAGTALAGTALHADWLDASARRLGQEWLAETGRRVQRLAHHWSAIRIIAGAGERSSALRRRADDLTTDYRRMVDALRADLGDGHRDGRRAVEQRSTTPSTTNDVRVPEANDGEIGSARWRQGSGELRDAAVAGGIRS